MISPVYRYFPAVVCGEFDSPIDALVSLCVSRDEAMELVTAAWADDPAVSVMTTVDGGRRVAVLDTPGGRWAACNAYPELACPNRDEAVRRLRKVLKRGRRGYLGVMLA